MALKTKWQMRQEAAGAREYARWDWLRGWEYGRHGRRVAIRKAGYIMGFLHEMPCRKK